MERERKFDIPSLASLECRETSRSGRKRTLASNLRDRFMECLDDDGKTVIKVYITSEGKVRKDVDAVLEEQNPEAIDSEDSDVDVEEVYKEDDEDDALTDDEDEDEKEIVQEITEKEVKDAPKVIEPPKKKLKKTDDDDYDPKDKEETETETESEPEEDDEDEETEEDD